jgi:predicted transcriptional regulator of viral defense system
MESNQNVRSWIEDIPKRGRITFSFDDVTHVFPNMAKRAVRSSIYRLIKKGRVCSVWRDYYVVVPTEYALNGFVPPIEYIDNLMNHLGHGYYAGLLSAAALHGSSHQQPQSFMVVSNSDNIKSKVVQNVDLRFIAKKKIPSEFLLRRNASYGEVVVSEPIMTSLDLIMYENRIGGLERAASVIDGLADVLNIADSNPILLSYFPIPVVQRFGYILESILGYPDLGEAIYLKIRGAGIVFRKTYLNPRVNSKKTCEYPYDSKWKIIINTDLELD